MIRNSKQRRLASMVGGAVGLLLTVSACSSIPSQDEADASSRATASASASASASATAAAPLKAEAKRVKQRRLLRPARK